MSTNVAAMSDDLRQLACLAQHKRHLVWRGPTNGAKDPDCPRNEGCSYCGLPWIDRVGTGITQLGELLRIYKEPNGTYTIHVQTDQKSTLREFTAIPLEAP